MRLDTFFEARDLYDKYQLCEKVMEYLSDEESVKGLRYKDTLAKFAEAFKMEFMTFVHERMEAVGMQFEDLKSCDCDKQPDVPAPPIEEKDPKFPIGSFVEVVSGIGKGDKGVVERYDPTADRYYVVSDKFYMWFPESDLKAYVEESEEQPETPTPPEDEDDKYEMVYGERVIVKSGEYAGKVGTIIDVMVGFTKILVGLDDVEDAVEFTPDQLAKYTDPENMEDDGGTVTPDTGE